MIGVKFPCETKWEYTKTINYGNVNQEILLVEFIDWSHLFMAILFFITALQRFTKQGESFFIRLILGGWFSLTTIFHELPVDLVRNGSAILIVIMLALESTAPYARRYWERK